MATRPASTIEAPSRDLPAGDLATRALAAATRLFAAKGVDATSIQEVADALSVTKQAILHHFPSKEALRLAALEGMLGHWRELFPRILLAATGAEDRFRAIVGELLRFFREDRDRARLLVREALDRPLAVRALMLGPVAPWLEAIAGYVRRGVERGTHHADVDPEAYIAHVLLQAIVSAASLSVFEAALGKGARDAEARLERELLRMARAALLQGEGSGAGDAKGAGASAGTGAGTKTKSRKGAKR